MNSLIPFEFDGLPVRVVQIDGEPWFVGKDVAERLGYADTTNAIKQHCKGVVKRHPLQTTGGVQEVRVLNQHNVLRLIVNSHLPAAERFEQWIFEDVIPTVLRTGAYSMQAPRPPGLTSRIKALDMIAGMVMQVPGVRADDVLTIKLDLIERETGLPATEYRRALPTLSAPEIKHYSPTAIGAEVGLSAQKVNQALAQLGLQERQPAGKGWALTEVGEQHAKAVPFTRNGHTGVELQWRQSAIDLLMEQLTKQKGGAGALQSSGTSPNVAMMRGSL